MVDLLNYSIIIISGIYAALCLFKKPKIYFREITATYIAMVISLLLVFAKPYQKELLDSYIVNDEFAVDKLISKERRDNSIVRVEMKSIKNKLNQLNSGRIELNSENMLEYPIMRMKELSNSNLEYLSTHIINNDLDADVFLNSNSEKYEIVKEFLNVQQENINKKGSLVRIFIIEENWEKNNPQIVAELEASHKQLFNNSGRVEIRFISLQIAKSILSGVESIEFNILNKEECFIWKEDDSDLTESYSGGEYIFNSERVKYYLDKWNSLYQNSYSDVNQFLKETNSKN